MRSLLTFLFAFVCVISFAQNAQVRMGTASGTDNYTVIFNPAVTSLNSQTVYMVTFTNGNSGASTIVVNAISAKDIKASNGDDLQLGAISSGSTHILAWNGTNFRLEGSSNFWPLNGTGTLLGNVTMDGNGSSLTFTDMNNFNATLAGSSIFTVAGGILWQAPNQPIEFLSAGNTYLRINDSGSGQSVLSGDGTGGVVVASPNAGLHIDNGTDDVRIFADDDIDLDPDDDLRLNNVSGITGQVISNTNGHPEWVDANTLDVDNIYNTDGTLTGERALSGASIYGLSFNSLTSFNIASVGPAVVVSASTSFTTTGGDIVLDASVDTQIHGDDDVHIDADDDLDLIFGDDLLINGISGTSNQFVGNVDGHAAWLDLPTNEIGDPTSALLQVETTTVGNVTTGEDVLWTYTLPADTLSVNGQFIRGRISGQVANNANLKTFKLKFGATTFLTRGTELPAVGQGYIIDWEVIRTGATTQKVNATFSGSDGIVSAFYSTAGETLSGTVDISLTGEATATDDIQKHSAVTTWGFGSFGVAGGGSGDISLSDLVASETPAGTVDGVNDDFTVSFTPTGFFHLYLNGLLQDEGDDFTRTGPNITFIIAPVAGSKIRSSYIK